MAPTLRPGQIVIAIKPLTPLMVGQVVVFTHNNIEKIKRIQSVEHDGLSVVGDNTAESTDSRYFGMITPRSVIGVVIWPKVSI